MGRSQRVKGATAEREVAKIFRENGFDSQRTAPLQPNKAHQAADINGVPGYHLEIKRQETIKIGEWTAQAEDEAPKGITPIVIYRKSHQPWRVVIKLEDFITLLKKAGIDNGRDGASTSN